MSITDFGNVIICGPGKQEVVVDRKDGEDRWCFKCRTQREFRYIVTQAVDWQNDWYGPTPSICCAVCQTVDGDYFPGRWREWDC